MRNDPLFFSSKQMECATNYNNWMFSLFNKYVRGSVLEVGCGIGTFTEKLVALDALISLYSIDISPSAIESCRKKIRSNKLHFDNIDVLNVNGDFDIIICINVLEHIKDDTSTINHLMHLLNPGGTLFLLVPGHKFLYTPFDTVAGHYRRYTKNDIRDLILRHNSLEGLKIKQYYFNIIGAMGYFFVYKVIRKVPSDDAVQEIGLFDRFVVPFMRHIEGRWLPFGLSLVTVVTKA